MIVKRRRMATHDLVLIVVAAGMIVVSLLPMAPPRRQVRLRDASGDMQTYSLLLDDPTLQRLQAEPSRTPVDSAASAALAVARWQAEVAQFYADQTRPREIMQVSFTDHPDARLNVLPLQRQHQAWLKVRADAEREIERWQNGFDRLQILDSPSSIEVGELIPARRPAHAYLIGLAVGLMVGMLFAIWTLLAPTVQMAKDETATEPQDALDPEDAFEFAFAVPSDWIRVRQSPSVWMRRAAEAALVFASMWMVFA